MHGRAQTFYHMSKRAVVRHSKMPPLMSLRVNRVESGGPVQVRFTPDSDQKADILDRQLRANSGLMHRSNELTYLHVIRSTANSRFGAAPSSRASR
jgi:hypothetical protein